MQFLNLDLKLIIALMIGGSIAFVSSCTSDNLEDLTKGSTCDTSAVSYQLDVAPIIQQNCFDCHAEDTYLIFGTVRLDEYQFLAPKATEDNLLCRINHSEGCTAMPRGGDKLPPCEIDKIEAWVNQGKQDN